MVISRNKIDFIPISTNKKFGVLTSNHPLMMLQEKLSFLICINKIFCLNKMSNAANLFVFFLNTTSLDSSSFFTALWKIFVVLKKVETQENIVNKTTHICCSFGYRLYKSKSDVCSIVPYF